MRLHKRSPARTFYFFLKLCWIFISLFSISFCSVISTPQWVCSWWAAVAQQASCNRKIADLNPLVDMSKCAWAKYWTPNCSRRAGRQLAWQPPPSVNKWITASCRKCKMIVKANWKCEYLYSKYTDSRPDACVKSKGGGDNTLDHFFIGDFFYLTKISDSQNRMMMTNPWMCYQETENDMFFFF